MNYRIPFKKRPVIIGQGFNGSSHKDLSEDKEDFRYSIDFLLPVGTKIFASKSGIITKVKAEGKKNYNGKNSDLGAVAYNKWMNEIEIKHNDGTFASYCHLKHKGAFVKVGERVKQGQVIGLSGNTGWSSEPHLDFSVFKKNIEGYKIKTIKIKFGDFRVILEDNYTRIIVKKSGIDRKGVFAIRDIKKRRVVTVWHPDKIVSKKEMGKLSKEEKSHMTPTNDGRYMIMGIPERFVNHSCNPNTFVKNRRDIALKNIKKGDEITSDYSINGIDNWEMKCLCGSENCRKKVYGDFFKLPTKQQRKYYPYLEDWFKEKFKERIKKNI